MDPQVLSIVEDAANVVSSLGCEKCDSCDNTKPDCDCYSAPCDCDRSPCDDSD